MEPMSRLRDIDSVRRQRGQSGSSRRLRWKRGKVRKSKVTTESLRPAVDRVSDHRYRVCETGRHGDEIEDDTKTCIATESEFVILW